MISGSVNVRYEAVVTLTVQGPTGLIREIDAAIDTGFNDFLALPADVISESQLTYVESVDRLDLHSASVLWDGRMIDVASYSVDGAALIGMRMLDRYNLNVDVEPGGLVAIRAKGDEGRGREARN